MYFEAVGKLAPAIDARQLSTRSDRAAAPIVINASHCAQLRIAVVAQKSY